MAFLQAQILHPKSLVDYKQTTIEFDTKDVHPIDEMDTQRQTRDIIYSTLNGTAITASTQLESLSNIQSQLKVEKDSSFKNDNKIKSLAEFVIEIGYGPSNVKEVEEIAKKKNVGIEAL